MLTSTRKRLNFVPHNGAGLNAWYANCGPRQYVLNDLGHKVSISQFRTGEKTHARRTVVEGITINAAKDIADQWESECGR